MLRRATVNDHKYCAEVRSYPEVYQNCGRQIPLTTDEFQKTLTKGTSLFVADHIGYIRFDDFGKDGFDIGIALEPKLHGKGLGTLMLKEGILEMRRRGTMLFLAKVRRDNVASQRIFIKNGFHRSSETSEYIYFSL